MAQAQAVATPATSRLALGPAVKEAAVTAFVAAVLLTPLLGMQIASGSLVFHFDEVAIGVAVVFVGRLLLTLLQGTGRGARRGPAARGRGRGLADQRQRQDPGPGRPRLRLRPALHAVLEPLHHRHRHHRADLRDAGLGAEHRGGPGGPARPRLRRVLRRRRLLLCPDRQPFRLELLGLPAAGGRLCRQLRHPAGLPGPAPARRLPGHRHAGLRRDHPHHPPELVARDRRAQRHLRHPAAFASSATTSSATRPRARRPSTS